MPILANPRHEAFCQARALGKTLDEAYSEAGYRPHRHNARRLSTFETVAARLKELQAKAAEAYEITTDSIARELDEAIVFARECKQPSAIVAAVMGKAKLAGLLTDKSSVVVTHNYALMSEEEIRFELAALAAEARSIKPGVQH